MVATALLTTVAERRAAILRAVKAVPRGAIASYGEIALRAGLPGRARLVGQVLRDSSDRRLPWHRVTGAQGRIAFPAGSQLFREQVRRLTGDGLQVERGRVVRSHQNPHDIDRLLWASRD
ncbi:MAG: MGMT family protein [Pseudomonadales bacterium]|nr:MGMT family protein [Pseudomonadales bacterium]